MSLFIYSFCSNWNFSFNLKSPSPHSVTWRLFLSIWALSEGILPALASRYRKQSSYRNKTNVMWSWISAVSFQSTFHTVKVENCLALMSNEAIGCMLFWRLHKWHISYCKTHSADCHFHPLWYIARSFHAGVCRWGSALSTVINYPPCPFSV